MDDEAKRGWTIQRDGGEPLPAPITELVERWLALTDGDPIAALVIAAGELTLLAPATSRLSVRSADANFRALCDARWLARNVPSDIHPDDDRSVLRRRTLRFAPVR